MMVYDDRTGEPIRRVTPEEAGRLFAYMRCLGLDGDYCPSSDDEIGPAGLPGDLIGYAGRLQLPELTAADDATVFGDGDFDDVLDPFPDDL